MFPVAYFHDGGQTTNPLVIALIIGTFLVAAGFFALASLVGFRTGWNAANALGAGSGLRVFLASDRVWQRVSTLFRRPYRLPLLLWLLSAWSAFGISGIRCWLNSGATVAEVPGTYRAEISPALAMLDLKADGSWEYRLEGQSEFVRAGKWTFEPRESDSSTVVITFKVESGFHQNQSLPGSLLERAKLARPGFVYSEVSRDCAGKLRVCFGADDRICFERMSETKR